MATSSSQNLPFLDPIPQKSPFLRAPLQLPTYTESVPFKPKDDDKISLSMKRCYQHHEKTSRYIHPFPGTPCIVKSEREWQTVPSGETGHRLYHCKSVPSLAPSSAASLAVTPSLGLKLGNRAAARIQPRRWTLSSKAACTRKRVVTAVSAVSAVYRPRPAAASDTAGVPSPAMIVLRRASTVRLSPPKKMSLTVFPEPKFERSRTWILTSFLRTITGATDEDKEPRWPRAYDGNGSIASLGAHGARLAHRGRSKIVCTKVTDVQPTMVSPTCPQADGEATSRRCSTQYITEDQVLEVIWDDNVSTCTSASSEPGEVSCTSSMRRHSVAIESLEIQLKKADAQSRRQSQATIGQLRKSSSWNEEDEQQRQSSLYSTLGFKLSRFANEAALQNVPRSRTSRARKRKGTTMGSGKGPIPDIPAEDLQTEQPSCTIDFFPPLMSPSRQRSTRINPPIHVVSIDAPSC